MTIPVKPDIPAISTWCGRRVVLVEPDGLLEVGDVLLEGDEGPGVVARVAHGTAAPTITMKQTER